MSTGEENTNVQLPSKLEGSDLLGLFDQLDARREAVRAGRRKGHGVPDGCPIDAAMPAVVAASWKRLSHAIGELRALTGQRDHTLSTAPAVDPSTANGDSDEAWRAFEGWLLGWTRHRDDGQKPSGADAQALYTRLFPRPDGLKFIGWRPRKQWSSMQSRMTLLAEPEIAASVSAIGGDRLLAALRAMHDTFGKAYGFTAAKPETEATIVARPQFLAGKDALRDYVKKVEGSADADVADSEALATWLLGPFNELVHEFASNPRAKQMPGAPSPVTPT